MTHLDVEFVPKNTDFKVTTQCRPLDCIERTRPNSCSIFNKPFVCLVFFIVQIAKLLCNAILMFAIACDKSIRTIMSLSLIKKSDIVVKNTSGVF